MLTARSAVIAAVSLGVLFLGGLALWERRRRRQRPAAAHTEPARRSAAIVRPQTRGGRGDVARDPLLPDGSVNVEESIHSNGTHHAGSGDTSSRKHVSTTVVPTSGSSVKRSAAESKADEDAVSTEGTVQEELVTPSSAHCFSTAVTSKLINGDLAMDSSVNEEHAYSLPPGRVVEGVPDSSAFDSVLFSSYDTISSPNEWIVIEGAPNSVAREEIIYSSGGSCLPEGGGAGICQGVPGLPDQHATVTSSCEQAVPEASVSVNGDWILPKSSDAVANSEANKSHHGTDSNQLVIVASHQPNHAGILDFSLSEQPASEERVLPYVAALDRHSPVTMCGYAGAVTADSSHLGVDAPSLRMDFDDSAFVTPVSVHHLSCAPDCKEPAQVNDVRSMCSPPAQGEMLSVESLESFELVASNSLSDHRSGCASIGKCAGIIDDKGWRDGAGIPPAVHMTMTEDPVSSRTGNETDSIVYTESLCGFAECDGDGHASLQNSFAGTDADVSSGDDRRHSSTFATPWTAGSDDPATSTTDTVVAAALTSQLPVGTSSESADAFVISSCTGLVEACDTAAVITAGVVGSEEGESLSAEHSFELVITPSISTSMVSSSSDAGTTTAVPAPGRGDSFGTDRPSDALSVSSSTGRATGATSDGTTAPAFCVGSSTERAGSTLASPDSSVAAHADGGMLSGARPTTITSLERESSAELLQGGYRAGDTGAASNGHADPAAADSSQSLSGDTDTESSTQASQPDSTGVLGPDTHSGQMKQVGTQQVFNFYLPTAMCGLFIGKKGRNVNHLKAKSGAFIHVEALPTSRDRHLCVIKGSDEAIRKAVDAIIERFPQLGPVLTADMYAATTPIGAGAVNTIDVSRLQLQLVPHSAVNVVLATVASATRAFVQLPTHPTYQSLERLSATLLEVYSGATADAVPPPLPEPTAPGALCAVESEGVWYRGVVIQQCEQYDSAETCVQLRYLDYGGYETVPLARIRQLRPDFLSLPFQAVECSLAHVKPRETTDSVSESSALSVLVSFTGGLLECINIGTDGDTGLPAVELYANSNDTTIFINQLVSEAGGMAWIN